MSSATNLADVLDFSNRDLAAPSYPFDPGPYASFCPPSEPDKWLTIRELARRN